MPSTTGPRQPAGTPAGGQFAAHAGSAPDLDLDTATAAPATSDTAIGCRVVLPMLPATHETLLRPRAGDRSMGYEVHSVHALVGGRAVDAGMNVHVGYVKAHQQWGNKYGVTAPGHHWDGIAQPVGYAKTMAGVKQFCSQRVAASGTTVLDGKQAWMSTVIDTDAGTATIRARIGNGVDRSGAQGYELRMSRGADGAWTVDSSVAGRISRLSSNHSSWHLAENTVNVPAEAILGWFAGQHNKFVGREH